MVDGLNGFPATWRMTVNKLLKLVVPQAPEIQGKVFTYMSHGLPVICSNKVSKNFGKNVLSYAKDNEIIEKIISLKTNKSKSNNFSRKSLKFVKNLTWKQVSKNYLKLIKL